MVFVFSSSSSSSLDEMDLSKRFGLIVFLSYFSLLLTEEACVRHTEEACVRRHRRMKVRFLLSKKREKRGVSDVCMMCRGGECVVLGWHSRRERRHSRRVCRGEDTTF